LIAGKDERKTKVLKEAWSDWFTSYNRKGM
jgi:hypothetical protein